MTTKPFPFQREDVDRLHNEFNGICLIGSEMGLGKTLQALLYAKETPDARPIVVVCPASLKWQWAQEASKHIGMYGEVLESVKPPREGIRQSPLYIINYDLVGWGPRGTNPKMWPWVAWLKALKPKLVILDECHYCQSRYSKRSRACRELCRSVPHILALSGTPMTNRPADLWQTLNILHPQRYPAFWPFAQLFCAPKRTIYGWDFTGASNLPLLSKHLSAVMIRRRKEEVLDQLPAKQRIIVTLPLSDQEQYDLAVKNFVGWLGKHGGLAKLKRYAYTRAKWLVRLNYLKQLAGKLKFKSVCEWLDNFLAGGNEKVIVFGVHRKLLKKLWKKYNSTSVMVTGSVTGRKRQQAFDAFLKSGRIRILFGQVKAAGEGWSARGVSNVAFVEYPWTPGTVIQAEDRCHGLGRGQEGTHTTIYYLVGRGCLDETLLKILQAKAGIADAVLDNGKAKTTLDVHTLLTQELEKEIAK